jgi:predicted O-methyltransferase YrrM
MLEIVHPTIERYLERLPRHGDPILRQMEAQAAREDFPIVGPQVGRLLMTLALAINARRVFEMGSGFGYSGLWFAKALPDGGCVTLTDTSAARSKQAQDYFDQAREGDKAQCLVGDAIELVQQATGPFDIIFLDADKARYPLAFKAALPKLRPGGLLIADNVLWFGQVTEPNPDSDTQGILEFTRLIYTTPMLSSSILPLRDGVSISLKRNPHPSH